MAAAGFERADHLGIFMGHAPQGGVSFKAVLSGSVRVKVKGDTREELDRTDH